MNFPNIRHIDDVLPAIEGRDEFVVGRREGYTFIDYNYVQSDTFDCPIRRECRGLKFDAAGNLIARPLHKFFNLHEKPNEIPDFSQDHVVMEKLDGSMVHPAIVNGELVFMTRAGVTEQAKMAMAACKRLPYGRDILTFCKNAIAGFWTPIFEFTSPQNQIVVRYPKEEITLLAVRHVVTGEYWDEADLTVVEDEWSLPVVRAFDQSARDIDAFVAHTRALPDMEGYVVRVGQHFVKVKADAYVASHRAKSGLLWEKDVLRLVLEHKVDDVAALLPPDESARLWDWSDRVLKAVGRVAHETDAVYGAMRRGSGDDRKRFAEIASTAPAHQQFWLFSILSGKAPYAVVKDWALKQVTNTAKARECLNILGVSEWVPTRIEEMA